MAMFTSLLCLFLAAGATGTGDVKCEGLNCARKPTPASLLSPTVVSPTRPATLVPPTVLTPKSPVTTTTRHTTPANHTTHHPANHTTHHPGNHTTHHPTPHPANHTTPHPANHTTHHPANHTTPHPANHTTPHPANHTTTHSVLTTTVHPPPPPELQSGHYNVTMNKTVCALEDLKLQFRIQYKNTKKETSWGLFMVQPKRTHASGTCGTDFVNMTLTFPEGFLMFGFKKDTKKQAFYLSEVKSELTYRFPGSAGPSRYSATNTSLRMLQADLGHSYRCSNQSVEAGRTFWVDLVDQQVQAFHFDKNQHFGPAELCPQDKKLPVVAIVVAVVLVVLILVVILVYVIGKTRAPAGYQSI